VKPIPSPETVVSRTTHEEPRPSGPKTEHILDHGTNNAGIDLQALGVMLETYAMVGSKERGSVLLLNQNTGGKKYIQHDAHRIQGSGRKLQTEHTGD
jgi:hypothetical protein